MVQVKLFDFEHEVDLEEAVNHFLQTITESQLIDIKYEVAVTEATRQSDIVFCFSAMLIYRLERN